MLKIRVKFIGKLLLNRHILNKKSNIFAWNYAFHGNFGDFSQETCELPVFLDTIACPCKFAVFIAEEPENIYEKKKASEIVNENL